MPSEIDTNYPQFIKIDASIKEKYLQDLINKNSGTCFAGQEQGQICLLAAAIGFVNGEKKKTNKPTDIRLYRTLSKEYRVLIRAIALADCNYNYDILTDGARVLKIIEEYANGGFQLLHKKIYDKGLDLSIEEDVVKLVSKIEGK